MRCSSLAAGAARRLTLLAVCIAVARCADPTDLPEAGGSHGTKQPHGPVVRSIVPDLDLALANEFAALHVARVVALSKKPECQGRIAALVSLKVDARCIPSMEEARTFLHAHEHSEPHKRENGVAIIVDDDYRVMPTFFWLSHRHQLQVLVTYGNISQATGEVGSGALQLVAAVDDLWRRSAAGTD